MQQAIRFIPKFAFILLIFAALPPVIWAQPRPIEAGPTRPAPGPGTAVPGISVSGPTAGTMMPSMFQGLISADEYKAFTAFQQHLNENPAIKEINAKIAALAKEMQQLRAEATATREKLISANPEIKAIQDKITSAIHTRGGSKPMPMPGSGSGPTPMPAKAN